MEVKKSNLGLVELHETSVVGPPAYRRAVVKSAQGFSKQVFGENKMKKNDEVVVSATEEKTEVTPKSEVTEPDVKEDVKVEETQETKSETKEESDEDNTDEDEAITEKSIQKAVDAKVEKYVKSKSFDELVEKSVEKAMKKKAKTEDSNKFPDDEKKKVEDKSIGELGAGFLAN